MKKLERKQRVILKWDKQCAGTITEVGEQVSEVKFDDGKVLFIVNEHLIKEKSKGSHDARQQVATRTADHDDNNPDHRINQAAKRHTHGTR